MERSSKVAVPRPISSRMTRLFSVALLTIVLSVEIGNPALGFYEKLGFTIQKTGASHHTMMWTPLMK
ncbi:MAG: ribosomal protein S18 acetylase RimI-like enzyme [Akkermansiaceae bacterium]|jgi:ribosomal protein S18 acetylase RimI-like enzyme